MKIRITDKRMIGDDEPVFIIAEVGNNHQGSMDLAFESISSAHDAGADAVSFQYAPLPTYCIKDMYSHPNLAFLKDCEFSFDQIAELGATVKKLDMAFSVNVEDSETLSKMVNIGIDFIKLCSADLTNLPYIRQCASKGLPLFFSTGAAYLGEIEQGYFAMKEAGLSDYVLYHTNSGYPTNISDAHIYQMDLLHSIFGGVKGYCDHTAGIIPSVVAVSRGAKVIEKHITTDRGLKGDDWMVSLEPNEFKTMVKYIRQAEASLGSHEKKPLACEESTRTFKRKSIISKVEIQKGQVLAEEHFCYKLPGIGLAPYEIDRLLGKRSTQKIQKDVVITMNMIEE